MGLHRIRLHVELSLNGRAAGHRKQRAGLQLEDARHQLFRRQPGHPLRDVHEVARGKWQQRPATLFPDAMPAAKTYERRLVGVVDDGHPGVTQRLAILGPEGPVEPKPPGVRGGLPLVAAILDVEGIVGVPAFGGARRAGAGHRGFTRRIADVADCESVRERPSGNRPGELHAVPP
jgi:hypothetical protein